MYSDEFVLAKDIAKNVGNFLKNQEEKKIKSLQNKDIKLELDKTSEDIIIKSLSEMYDYPILSEECGLTKEISNGEPYWIIDPIDGTMNYSRDIPISCVSIALWIDQVSIFGVIYDFNRDELFSGYVGRGAWLNGKKLQALTMKDKSQAVLATGFPTYLSVDTQTLKDFISKVQQYKKIRLIGSAALSLGYVACGRFDAYIEQNIKLWDIAAGVAINEALGNGVSIDFLDDYTTFTKVGIV